MLVGTLKFYIYLSLTFVVTKGNSSHLMKISSKRRRTKEECKEAKRIEKDKNAELARRLTQI